MKIFSKYPQHMQWLFMALVVLIIGTMLTLFYQHRKELGKPDQQVSQLDNDTSISIKKLSQTMMRKGKKDWVLDAASAKYNDVEKKVYLTDLFITFFLKNDKKVTISADAGWLNNMSKNIIVSGNVQVKHDKTNLITDKLIYTHDKRIISTQVPVKIVSDLYQLKADQVSMDLNTNKIVFKGNVRGFFSDQISL